MAAMVLGILLQAGGETAETVDFCLPGLRYLARHQAADGSWEVRPPWCTCPTDRRAGEDRKTVSPERIQSLVRDLSSDGVDARERAAFQLEELGDAAVPRLKAAKRSADPEVRLRASALLWQSTKARPWPAPPPTALAVLAFLGAGYSHLSKDTYDDRCFGDVIRNGLRWIIGKQDKDGCIADRRSPRVVFHHAMNALALSEAYGLTGSKRFKHAARKATEFLVAAQARDGAWGYSYRSAKGDIWVTGWALMAMKSAEEAGLPFPTSVTGRVLHASPENGLFRNHETATAIGMLRREWIDKKKDCGAADRLWNDLPEWRGWDTDLCHIYWGTMAMSAFDGWGGPYWRRWRNSLRKGMLEQPHALSTGCRRDSW